MAQHMAITVCLLDCLIARLLCGFPMRRAAILIVFDQQENCQP